ncbi:hypothetical protein TorRG33x02_297280 [Trema orientale]|uniref:Uncharacterized protein n=1 Tax=Trema orientale TaxID=63057 RepID=A0A2P5C4V8_TREOI|nr:hypothetical protein TorRG33x02_297280 [Trema orientale]
MPRVAASANAPVVVVPLISVKDHHHTAAIVPPASSNYINHVDTFHISLHNHCHTATIASLGSMVTATAAATLGISEDDHHMASVALPCLKDDCHSIALALAPRVKMITTIRYI